MNSSDSFPASMAQRIVVILLPLMTSPPPPPPHKAPLDKLHGCSTVAARAFRPSRQESQTAQRRPHGPDTDSSPQSYSVRAATLRVSACWSTSSLSLRPFLAPCACSVSALLQFSSELHCQSYNTQSFYPLVHFISLSLSDLFWLPAHAPCLLYYSSPQSCTVRAAMLRVRSALPSKPLEEIHHCSPSVCDHFVRDLPRVLNSVVLREFHTE